MLSKLSNFQSVDGCLIMLTLYLQNKLITVTPDTKVLQAMQLMTG